MATVRILFGYITVLVSTFGYAGDTVAIADDPIGQLQQEFDQEITPILKTKCAACHSGEEANAGISFDSFQRIEQILNADRKWSLVNHEIVNSSMPPEGEPQLSAFDSKKLLDWIERVFKLIDCDTINPGNVTIRKLTRYEYRNSVRDLFDVDYSPADNFPGDDVGHGFDNVADVLSLPPVLLEKYLDAAEEISQQAIFDPEKLALDISLAATSFEYDSKTTNRDGRKLVMFTNGQIKKTIHFPEYGAYALAVRAYGDQAGDEDVQMSLIVDDEKVETVAVDNTKRRSKRFVFRIPVYEPGDKTIAIRFENDYYVPREVGSQDRNLIISGVFIKGPKRKQSEIPYLKFSTTGRDAAVKYVSQIVPRAFRCSVNEDQNKRFVALFDQCRKDGLSFYESLRSVTQAILISPQFLYRYEQPVVNDSIRPLNDYERATSLSYFLWSSTPDDELLQMARESKLSEPQIWDQQIQRLMQHDQSKALIENFAAQWLNLKVLEDFQPDPKMFPTANHQLLNDMATETKMVVEELFKRDASILELLNCDFTFVNDQLAAHYDMGKVGSSEFIKTPLPKNRSGILSHGSILTLTSNPTRTSPVKRGKWVMENILGEDPPPPLADVMPLDDQKELTGSLRERMQQHRTNPACASCHAKMDALGFALENYDAVGRFRLKDDGFDIDATSEMPDGTLLDGAIGLQKQLQSKYKDQFIRCFTEKLLTYALGRGLQYYDRCTVQQIIERASKQDYRISEFIFAIAQSETFLNRSGNSGLVNGAVK